MIINKWNKSIEVVWWSGENLGEIVALDTETELIQDEATIPKLVISTAYAGSKGYCIKNEDIERFLLTHKSETLVLANFPFDQAVLENHCSNFTFHKQIVSGKIHDTNILYRLYHLATRGQVPFKYSLDKQFMEFFKAELPKDDAIRLTFGQYRKDGVVDYKSISDAHIEYAVLDPVATFMCYKWLRNKILSLPTNTLLSHKIQLMGDIALAKARRNGIGVDLPYTEKLRNGLLSDMDKNQEVLSTYGYVRGQKGNTKAYNKIIDLLELDIPKSEKTNVYSMKEEELTSHRKIPFIKNMLAFLSLEKKASFLNLLTSERVHPKYNSIINTARTSCSSPNIQNPPRQGGVRECFVPKAGHIFIDVDYDVAELCAMAQINYKLFGYSKMKDIINSGQDVHKAFATDIFDCDISEVTKDQRQFAKVPNFGFVANMSAETFVEYAYSMAGLEISVARAKELKNKWKAFFPEMEEYWKRGYGKSLVKTDTGFLRANCSYTAFLNTPMQYRVAAGAKIAGYNLCEAGYKISYFIHDQYGIEYPKTGGPLTPEEALEDVKKIMKESMEIIIPDVKIGTDGKLLERFQK